MTDLHQQLQDSIRELEQIRKVRQHLDELNKRLDTEQAALNVMEKTLAKEQRDVETLEREGLTTMLRKFIGDREEKLEKEREEYLKASLRYNELYKSVQLIRYELDLLARKEANEEIVKNRIDVQLKMREKEIMELDPATGEELKNLLEQTDRLTRYAVQVEEAFVAGNDSLTFVRAAERHLLDAQSWGQRDMWGGRHGSSHMKHQSINEAKSMANQARHALIKFGHELKDVYKEVQLKVNMDIEEFGKFGDIFFDNIISDYLAQQKINKSLANVSATRQQLENVMHQLQEEKGNIMSNKEDLERQRRDIIVNAKS